MSLNSFNKCDSMTSPPVLSSSAVIPAVVGSHGVRDVVRVLALCEAGRLQLLVEVGEDVCDALAVRLAVA
eukprot:321076-Pyramimonas_sp.AAC.1